ncbi:MAG: MGMT family protein, partial [Acetobacteraceae bacterium]|nr:MGMT family protein [Acetobacteraceae bacterium]
MPRSDAFARIKADILAIIRAVPEGAVVTFSAIGAHLDVAPRHAAYILATLAGGQDEAFPWHRAVAADGALLSGPRGARQAVLLAEEGHAVTRGKLDGLAAVVELSALPHGVAKQTRPEATPSSDDPAP